jgi:hypothetical protein
MPQTPFRVLDPPPRIFHFTNKIFFYGSDTEPRKGPKDHQLYLNAVRSHKEKGTVMWLILFILGLIGAILLFIHINLELNSLGKGIDNLIAELKKHYEIK